jgi:hypothetical protein
LMEDLNLYTILLVRCQETLSAYGHGQKGMTFPRKFLRDGVGMKVKRGIK